VIQHIYDSHYNGAARAADMEVAWKTLKGHIDEERFKDVLGMLQYQAREAIVWRDTVCNWIYRLSGIADEKGRVGKNPAT